MQFNYAISNPAFNVAEGNNIAGTGGNTTLYKTATRNDFNRRVANNGTLVNITLKGIIPDLVNGYFKDYQVNFIHLMDNLDVWPYNTCFFSISKTPRTTPPVILGGMAAKIYSPNPADCFDFVYYSGSNNGMNKLFGPGKKNKVIRQLPGKGRNQVAYDYTDTDIKAGPKFAFYTMESRKSYTITNEAVYGGTICYIPTATIAEAEKLKLFVEKNPVFKEYVKRMKLRGHAFGMRNVKKFDINQIVTGLETPKEWNITPQDLAAPKVLNNDITEDRDRVKALGEVFTPTSLVEEVLDVIEQYNPTVFTDPTNTFIDSMCGDGQFLVAIQKRTLGNNIYGIDLTQSNVEATQRRLPGVNLDNIICADSLGDTLSTPKIKKTIKQSKKATKSKKTMIHTLLCSDNISAMRTIADNTIDACITDPPYGMEIADVGWDRNVPPVETWQEVYRVLKPGAFVLSFCNPEFYHRMAVNVEDAGFLPRDMVVWMVTTKMAKANRLKPAHEPIFVAQKPLDGTIEKNWEKWGCGRINTTTTRVPWDGRPPTGWIKGGVKRRAFGGEVEKVSDQKDSKQKNIEREDADPTGRYPSNIIGHFDEPEHQKYFYAPRATRKERGEYNDHPTPKPISLMRYLCRVYAPRGGLILDPFLGSGSTAIGALQESCNIVGIDMSQHYVDIATKRINDHYTNAPAFEKLFKYE